MSLPSVCFVGTMTGQNPGGLPTQGEALAGLLAQEGYRVMRVSTQTNRFLRLADIILTLVSRRREFELLILQTYSGQAFWLTEVASLLGTLLRKRIIMHLHGGNLPAFSRQHPRWVRQAFRRADHLVAPSTFLAHELEWLGMPIEVIPNVLDLSRYPFRPRSQLRPRLLWMRSFHEIYNPEMAVRVLAELLPHAPDATLSMAGPDKGSLPKVQQLARELGIGDRIQFPGFLDEAGKIKAGQEHDIYLNTNRIDNMPVSVLEMGAMGLPVVATAVGGIRYLLTEGENAILVADDDHQSMAGAILRLLQDPGLAAHLSHNGRCLAESSSWGRVRTSWQQVLNR